MPVPSPIKGDKQSEWMGRCVPFFMKENTPKAGKKSAQKQAAAICMSMYERHDAKKYEDLLVERKCETIPSGMSILYSNKDLKV